MPRCEEELSPLSYEACPGVTTSDHTPVGASYELRVRGHPEAPPLSADAGSHTHLKLTGLTIDVLAAPGSSSAPVLRRRGRRAARAARATRAARAAAAARQGDVA